MRKIAVCLVLALTLVTVACTPIEQDARNTAAALQGAIGAAQTQYLTACKADATQTACITINQAVAGQGALVTATEAYCGWAQNAPPPNATQTCVPVNSAKAGLQTAINNANLFITEIKTILNGGK